MSNKSVYLPVESNYAETFLIHLAENRPDYLRELMNNKHELVNIVTEKFHFANKIYFKLENLGMPDNEIAEHINAFLSPPEEISYEDVEVFDPEEVELLINELAIIQGEKNQKLSISKSYPRDISEIHPDILNSTMGLIEVHGEIIYRQLLQEIIQQIQEYGRDVMFSPDDSPLENLWDEYCGQIQSEKSMYFNMQDNIMESKCELVLSDLKENDTLLYDTLATYLTIFHNVEFENNTNCLLGDELLLELITSEIQSIAMDYTNSKIQDFISNF